MATTIVGQAQGIAPTGCPGYPIPLVDRLFKDRSMATTIAGQAQGIAPTEFRCLVMIMGEFWITNQWPCNAYQIRLQTNTIVDLFA